ncbi:hypothetical protein Tco_0994831 [Tanacetum coccineum]
MGLAQPTMLGQMASRFQYPLQILLADAATQTEDKESPRLLRPMHLAIFALEYHIPCIPVRGWPIISGPHGFGDHGSRSSVHAARPFMYFSNHIVRLERTDTPKPRP